VSRVRRSRCGVALLVALMLTACTVQLAAPLPTFVPTPILLRMHTSAPTPTPYPTVTPEASDTPLPTITPYPTTTPVGLPLWLAPDVPTEFESTFGALVSSGQFTWGNEAAAYVKVETANASTPADQIIASWTYAPVVAFPTLADDISMAAIRAYWAGNLAALSAISDVSGGPTPATPAQAAPLTFVVSQLVLAWLTHWLGAPAANVPMQVVPPDGVAATLWKMRPAAWSIVPFQQLDTSEKVLTVDSANVLSPQLDSHYPLVQALALDGQRRDLAALGLKKLGTLPTTNRDVSKLTVLVMTGTTALTRATAYQMEQTGITLPARDILPFLADANIVHTSNEVAFATDCPYPNPSFDVTGLTFCASDKYIDLLTAIHLRVVELTGNHVNDWGTAALSHTLDVYDANAMLTFGGGRDAEHARQAALVVDHGNTIAFIGCNPVGPPGAWATDTMPGAAKCDDDYLSKEIPRLKKIANVVIMTLQYQEYYEYDTPQEQVDFFRKYADMGADVVFGSQAHQPQGFAFVNGTFIHYGTGNLFFDQMDNIATRQMFADKLILYNGRHISTTLFTGISEDYSRPRPMTTDERSAFLATIFGVSGWNSAATPAP